MQVKKLCYTSHIVTMLVYKRVSNQNDTVFNRKHFISLQIGYAVKGRYVFKNIYNLQLQRKTKGNDFKMW